MDRWWRGYLAVVAVLALAWALMPSAVARDVAYLAIGLVSVAGIAVGTVLRQTRCHRAWYVLGLGQLMLVVGDSMYSWYQDVDLVNPFPSPADAVYLSAYPVLVVGLLMLVRCRRTGRDLAGWIDAAVVAAALGLIAWVGVGAPTIADQGVTFPALLSLAYPVADLVLLAVAGRLFIGGGERPTAYVLLVCSLGALMVADAAYTLLGAGPSAADRWLDAIWLASYVLAGAAALHRTAGSVSQPTERQVRMTWWRVAGLAAAVMVTPGIEVWELVSGADQNGWPLVGGYVLLIGLAFVRLQLSVREAERAAHERLLMQERLAHQAAHDDLTGAASRARTLEVLEQALGDGRRAVGLLYVDLDHFKQVNDTFGHIVGDEVLREVSRRIGRVVRPSDVVGRVGGDEIVVLVFGPASEPVLVDIATRIVVAVAAPLTIEGHELSISASVGVALSRDGVIDADELVREADLAAYRAKFDGRARVQVFGDALRTELAERAELEGAIRAGLAADEFVMHYQPLVEVDTGRVVGYEALARWERPGYGLVAPSGFIPAAERTSLICDIGRWGLAAATRQIATWDAEGRPPVTVSVNVSGRYLGSAAIVDDVVAALLEARVPASRLVLEVTETVQLDAPAVAAHLRSLQQVGVGIHIDDFGTGYTSIGQLQHLPATALKIDRSLIALDTAGARELVALAVHAAHAVGLQVVAEGVETAAQLQVLRELGCDLAQGFHIAVPAPADEVQVTVHPVDGPLGHPVGRPLERSADLPGPQREPVVASGLSDPS